jgi:hypothetical protein
VDMPLNSIPATTTVSALRPSAARRAGSAHRCWILGWIQAMTTRSSRFAAAFVDLCFMTPSGVDEFASVVETDLRRALPRLAHWSTTAPLSSMLKTRRCFDRPKATLAVPRFSRRPAEAEAAAIRLSQSGPRVSCRRNTCVVGRRW